MSEQIPIRPYDQENTYDTDDVPLSYYGVRTEGGSRFGADDNGNGDFTFLTLRVAPEDGRRSGLGTRLVSALTRRVLEHGGVVLHGSVESQHTLRIFRRLFGESRMSFTDVVPRPEGSPGPVVGVQLPITLDQAIASLEQAETHESDPESRDIGLGVSIDLTGLRPEDFEEAASGNEA